MDFREFSKAYNNYLMHGDSDMSLQERISKLKAVLKKNRSNVPSQKKPQYDALTQIVVEQAQNGNIQAAKRTCEELGSLSGSPSYMLLQYIISHSKEEVNRVNENPRNITGHRK